MYENGFSINQSNQNKVNLKLLKLIFEYIECIKLEKVTAKVNFYSFLIIFN